VIVAVLVLAAVVAAVTAPLREARRAREAAATQGPGEQSAAGELDPAPDRDALEAAREGKYREIRDAELDYRTGKLSREDYEAIDRALRAEAIEILDRLQAADG